MRTYSFNERLPDLPLDPPDDIEETDEEDEYDEKDPELDPDWDREVEEGPEEIGRLWTPPFRERD